MGLLSDYGNRRDPVVEHPHVVEPVGRLWTAALIANDKTRAMRKMRIRPAVEEDLPTPREIERDSGQHYREWGLDHVADDEPAPIEILRGYADEARAWIALDDSDQPIGYILVDIIDGGGHIEQVSVTPAHQSRGVGRALIEQVRNWAISMNLWALTLTTFGHIPWNPPLYEHLGFRVLPLNQISPSVQQIRDAEAVHGLDPNLRVVMLLVSQAGCLMSPRSRRVGIPASVFMGHGDGAISEFSLPRPGVVRVPPE